MKYPARVFAATLLLASVSASGQNLDEFKKRIAEKQAAWDTYSADVTSRWNLGTMSLILRGTEHGKGAMRVSTTAWDIFNMKLRNRTVIDAAGVQWRETDMMGEQSVVKSAAGSEAPDDSIGMVMGSMFGAEPIDPRTIVTGLETGYDMTSLGEETLEGTEVFVIGGQLHEDETEKLTEMMNDAPEEFGPAAGFVRGMISGFMQVRAYIGVADGFPRKVEFLTQDGAATITQTFTNIKINEPIDDSLFVYAPPDGVEVVDLDVMTATNAVRLGDVAPDFDVIGLDGSDVKLADYKGKVVLLDFWAIWCAPCIVELPNVIALYNEYHPQGLELLGISLDGDRSKVVSFMVENPGMTWPQIFDGNAWESEVATLYGVEMIPLTVLIGKDGTIRALDLHGEALEKAVAEALAE